MSVNEKMRQKLLVSLWSVERHRGAVKDKHGVEYCVEASDLAEGVQDLQEGEFAEGIVLGFNKVAELSPTGEFLTERKEFESVGASAGVVGWNPHRGGIPQKFGTPDSGHFSHPQLHVNKK